MIRSLPTECVSCTCVTPQAFQGISQAGFLNIFLEASITVNTFDCIIKGTWWRRLNPPFIYFSFARQINTFKAVATCRYAAEASDER